MIAEETRKPYDLTYGRVASGFAHILAGQPQMAVVDLSMALEQCRSGNIPILVPSVARYLGRAYALIGQVDAAHELLEESIKNCRAQSMMALTIWCGLASGHAHIEGGTHDDASERLEHILGLARKHAYRPAEAHGWHLLARARLAQGEIEAACAALANAETMARQLGMFPELTALKETRLLFEPQTVQE